MVVQPFEFCCLLILDDFLWKSVLGNMSYGNSSISLVLDSLHCYFIEDIFLVGITAIPLARQ